MAEHLKETPAEAVRRHIAFKASMGELRVPVAGRMLAALDGGAEPDYAALFEAATFLPLPDRCFHTAPCSARSSIEREGLRAALPSGGANWGAKAAGQTTGVYVGPDPDHLGRWAHGPEWDVWEVDTSGLTELQWKHDRLNPGCWVLLTPVASDLLRWRATHVLSGESRA